VCQQPLVLDGVHRFDSDRYDKLHGGITLSFLVSAHMHSPGPSWQSSSVPDWQQDAAESPTWHNHPVGTDTVIGVLYCMPWGCRELALNRDVQTVCLCWERSALPTLLPVV
jgi:hypothetical protein